MLTARSLAYWAILPLIFMLLILYSFSLHGFGFDSTLVYLSGIPFTLNGKNLTPVKSYLNADIDKKSIYDENQKQSGIYCWTNLTNQNCYVGSSSNLSRRFSWYYSLNNINKVASVSLISRALLKYGYSRFRLDILEYCNTEQLIDREQYYIDLINPEYNILRVAGSSLGHKHSEATLAKLTGRKLSSEHLVKLREHLSKHNLSEEQRTKARARMLNLNKDKGIEVYVLDTQTKETTKYSSIREAAKEIGCAHITLIRAEKVFLEKGIEKLINGRFIVKINR